VSSQAALTLFDIPWLRRAAAKSGAHNTPHVIAARLLAGGLVVRGVEPGCLRITRRGEIALTRLT
jgi:hypothetical protein